jgi:DNA-binding beta-propeller fold protein YncE
VASPLTSEAVRLLWLRSCCAVAEGADVPQPHTGPRVSSRCSAAVCVAAVLGDAEQRVAVLGGREGMPRSLASVYGGAVTRFLGGSCRGVVSRVIQGVTSSISGVAVSHDGSTLLVSDCPAFRTSAIHELSVADGSRLRVIGGAGDGPIQFAAPCQVWVASDDFVFVAELGSNRLQVLTPTLDFHAFVGVGQLVGPGGVCADDAVIVVSELDAHRISVFSRGDGALLRRFAKKGRGDGQLICPRGLCFTSGHRHVAVADYSNSRVSVFSVEGEFVRHVGVGELRYPSSVACSALDELVVADCGRVAVFSASGELVKTMGDGGFIGVALHGGTIFAHQSNSDKCVVFK